MQSTLSPIKDKSTTIGAIDSSAARTPDISEELKDEAAPIVDAKQLTKSNKDFGKHFHLRSEPEKKILKIMSSKGLKKTLDGVNVVTLLINFVSSAMSLLPLKDSTKDQAYKISATATKAALGIISGVSGSKRLIGNRNILLGSGQGADPTINTWAYDFVDLFLGRGFSYGTTIIGIGLNRAAGSEDFENWSECIKSWAPGFRKIIEDAGSGFIKNYFNAKSGLMSFANGVVMILGSIMGFMNTEDSFGRKIGATIRTVAGMLQDFERCLTRARPLYFKSGICHLAESILALFPKYFPQNKTVKIFFTSLGMGLGNLGRFLFADAQDKGELTNVEGKTLIEEFKEWWSKPKS